MDRKIFTPAEATRMLPLVRQIVEDILACGQELQEIRFRLGDQAGEAPGFQQKVSKLERYSDELKELGCEFKDWNFRIGLVDFPAVIEGRDVLLCWRSDEEELKFYHGPEEGYLGRKLIPQEYFAEK